MPVQDDAAPRPDAPKARPAGYLIIIVGAVVALLSLSGLSWYTLSGRNVVGDVSQAMVDPAGVAVLVPSRIGREHSWVTWLVFATSVAAALVSGMPKSRGRTAARVIAPALAGVLILFAVVRVAVASFAIHAGAGSAVAGTSISLRVGFWLAIAGYILIAVGAMLGPRRRRSNA